jgi:hypothetical protein
VPKWLSYISCKVRIANIVRAGSHTRQPLFKKNSTNSGIRVHLQPIICVFQSKVFLMAARPPVASAGGFLEVSIALLVKSTSNSS